MLSKGKGGCPECAMPVPLRKTVAGRGKSFACKACGTMIVLPKMGGKQVGLAAAAVTAVHFLGNLAIVPALLLVGAIDWATAPVQRAR